MHRIMSAPALLLFFFYITLFFPSTLQQGTLPPKAINPERAKVMKDALSWMTFRKDGNLATDQDLEPFSEALQMHYYKSKYFRTMIVAFKDGVLPWLTLNENNGCDPAYLSEYRDPFNNSMTYGLLKKFLFASYNNRDDSSPRRYCDYRQGLVCNEQSKKCECPKGSKMGPISQGSTVQRCQMEENENCALIDLNHDSNSKYGALKKVLPEMLFNLEKPLSCKMGTQCRFNDDSQISPSCYNSNNGGPWAKGTWGIDLGEECTLGLYADSGPCRYNDIGSFSGYTCYNFGVLKPTVPPMVGLCAHDLGSYGITTSFTGDSGGRLEWNPLFIGFVSPATTPLRGTSLRQYYHKYLGDVFAAFVHQGDGSTQTGDVDGPCNVVKTEEMLSHFKFFLSLEGTPSPGEDHVATEAQLQNRLQKVADMRLDWRKKTCKVFTLHTGHWYISKALRCVALGGSPGANGNDGKCEYVPENEDMTRAWAAKFKKYRDYVGKTYQDQKMEEEQYKLQLIGWVEIECDPKLGKPPGSEGAPTTEPGDNDVLEGGYCPPDRGCYKNYGDYLNIYNEDNCNWNYAGGGAEGRFRDCQWLDESRKFGKCEERKLNEKIKEELSKFSSSNGLGRGDPCDYDFEKRIRRGIRSGGENVDGNKYKFLWEFQNVNNGLTSYNGFCDRTKLLECTEKGTCECIKGTAPRNVKFEGVEYMSDYCYVTDDYCTQDRLNHLYNAEGCVQGEREDIEKHYKGGRQDNCWGSNWCVYVWERKWNDHLCTTQNTGDTGFIPLEPKPETEKPETEEPGGENGGGNKPCGEDDPYCDYEDAGKGKIQLHESFKIIMIVVMMIAIKKNYQ